MSGYDRWLGRNGRREGERDGMGWKWNDTLEGERTTMDDLTIRLDTLGMEEFVTVDELGQLIKKMKVEGRASCTVADLLSNLRNLQVENSQDLNPPLFMFQDPGLKNTTQPPNKPTPSNSRMFEFTTDLSTNDEMGKKSIFEGVKGLSRQTAENENPNNSPQNLDVSINNSKHASSPWSAMSVESVSPMKPTTSVSQQDKEADESPFLFSFNMGVSSSSSSSQSMNSNNFYAHQRNKGGKVALTQMSPGKSRFFSCQFRFVNTPCRDD